jgi:hypothetical protein
MGKKESNSKDKSLKSTDGISEKGLQILLNEYNHCNDRIESFQKRQDVILQISLAIVGGAMAFLILNDVPDELYIIIPLLPILLFTHILYHYSRVIANQGYREYLQSRLNKFLPEDSPILYTSIGKKYLLHTNPLGKVNTIIFPTVIVLAHLYSSIMSNYNIFVVTSNILLFIIVIRLSMVFFKFTRNLNEEVKAYSEDF